MVQQIPLELVFRILVNFSFGVHTYCRVMTDRLFLLSLFGFPNQTLFGKGVAQTAWGKPSELIRNNLLIFLLLYTIAVALMSLRLLSPNFTWHHGGLC